MSVVLGELRKLLWWRNLALVLAVGGLYYWVVAWSQVDLFPNGHPMTEEHQFALAWHDEFGPTLDPGEMAVIESRLATMVSEADRILGADPALAATGVHSWQEVITRDDLDPAAEQIIWQLLFTTDGLGWKIHAVSSLAEQFGPLPEHSDLTPAQLGRVRQINETEEWRAVQSAPLLDFLTGYLPASVSLLFLVNLLIAAPLITTDRVNRVRQLQATSATGRRLLRIQLATTIGLALLVSAGLIGLISVPVARFGFSTFWATGIQSFATTNLYPSVTLGHYCWLLAILLVTVGVLAGLLGFLFSRLNHSYPTLVISLMITLALGLPALTTLLGGAPALGYGSAAARLLATPWAALIVLTAVSAAALAAGLVLTRREHIIDIQDQ